MSDTTDIKSTLMYGTNNKIRPYFYAYERSEEERKSSKNESDLGGEIVETEVTVKDGRKVDGISLNKNSFEFVSHETSLSTEDFYEEGQPKVKETYYAEIAELMKKHTGAAHVMIFHHQVRNQEKANGAHQNLHTSVQGYARGIHSDSSKEGAEDLFIQTVNNDEFEKYKSGRFLYLNAWRNISDTPIGNNHLAVCDETSLASPDDYIPTDLFMGSGNQILQYRLSNRNSDQHRWYYYPQMKKNEVILFKQWDSDTTLKGRLCFHTAFQDPNALDDIPPRQSIEARGICFFPDHEPNTCPILTEPEDGGDDEKLIKNSVDKICGTFQYIHMFPAEFKPWFLKEASKGVTGIKTIAESFAKDEKGYFGCKKASEETKKKIVDELMKGDKIGIEIRKAVEKLTKNKNTGGTVQYLVSKGIMMAIGGVLGYMLKASMSTFEQDL